MHRYARVRVAFVALVLTLAPLASVLAADRVAVLQSGGAWVERELAIPRGAAELSTELPRQLDGSSLEIALAGRALGARLATPPQTTNALLEDCLGRAVRLLPAGQTGGAPELNEPVTLVGLGADGRALVQLPDAHVAAVPLERVACPVAELPLGPRVTVPLPAKAKGALALRYRLLGWSWRAQHQLERGAKGWRLATRAELQVPADIGLDAPELQLIAGDVPAAPAAALTYAYRSPSLMEKQADAPRPSQEAVTADLLVFTPMGSVALDRPGLHFVPLREPADLAVEELFVVSTPVPTRWGGQDEARPAARRELGFRAPKGGPLPAGLVKVGTRDASGTWLPLGAVSMPRHAPGERVELRLGETRDIELRWRRPSLETLPSGRFRNRARVALSLRNAREEAAVIEVTQPLGGPYELEKSTLAPSEKRGTALVWRVELAPGASRTIEFTAQLEPRRR